MKTKLLGLLTVVILVWMGSTAYIGSKVEPYLNNYVEKSNQVYEEQGIKLSVEKFEKGFFSSQALLKFDIVDTAMKEELQDFLKLPIDINYTIENGPLLFQNGLGFGANRVVNSLKLSDYLVEKETFLELVNKDIVMNSQVEIGFNNNARFEVHTNEIAFDEEDDKLTMTPLALMGEMNLKTFQGDMELRSKQLTLKSEYEEIVLQGMVLNGNITRFYENGFYLGDFSFKTASLNAKTEDIPFDIKNANLVMEMTIDENVQKDIDIQFDLEGDLGETKLPTELAFFKKFHVAYALNGTKLEGLLAFQDYSKRVEAKQEELMDKLALNASGTFDENAFSELTQFQKEIENEMVLLIAGLLNQNRTAFLFNTKIMDIHAKEATLGVQLKYVGEESFPKDAEKIREKFEKEFLSLFAANVKLDLNKEYIENLPKELKQELSSQLQLGAMFGVIQDNNSSFGFEADYTPKTLMVNGKDRSEMLQLLEMSMQENPF